MGFIRDIEDMPNQFEYSKAFFDRWYGRNTRPDYCWRCQASRSNSLVEKYWSGWKRGSFTVTIPRSPLQKARSTRMSHGPTRRSHGSPSLFMVRLSPRSAKDLAAVDALMDLNFGQTSEVYKRLVEQEQKVDQLIPYVAPTQDPSLVTVLARVKRMEDVLERQRRVAEGCRFCDGLRHRRHSAWPMPNRRPVRAGAVSGQHGTDRFDLARFVRFSRSYQTLNKYYHMVDFA